MHPQESFPEYPELLCEAISLGRRHQEPLLEFSSLACAEDDELLSLKMDPLQSSLDTDDLRSCLELELVTRVNDVGVDINFCLENPHGVGMLPFVCGLGPRKAMFLLKVSTILLSLFWPYCKLCDIDIYSGKVGRWEGVDLYVCSGIVLCSDSEARELSAKEQVGAGHAVFHWTAGLHQLCRIHPHRHQCLHRHVSLNAWFTELIFK